MASGANGNVKYDEFFDMINFLNVHPLCSCCLAEKYMGRIATFPEGGGS